MQYCCLQHQTLLPPQFTCTTGFFVLFCFVLFLLWLCLFILSAVISPLISSSILGTYRPEEFIFQCHIFLPFHTVHGVLKARILKWFVRVGYYRTLRKEQHSQVIIKHVKELSGNTLLIICLVPFFPPLDVYII